MLASAVVGSGLGFLSTAVIVTVQSSVPWVRRGVVTGLVQFRRAIGGAVDLLGGILSAVVGPRASEILDPLRRADVPPRKFDALAASLTTGLVGSTSCSRGGIAGPGRRLAAGTRGRWNGLGRTLLR